MHVSIIVLASWIVGASAHMLMSFPPPRGYKGNPSYGNIDYDLSSPMKSTAMCKGKPAGQTVLTVNGTQHLKDAAIISQKISR